MKTKFTRPPKGLLRHKILGLPHEYYNQLREFNANDRGQDVILYSRVSHMNQYKEGNLDNHMKFLRKFAYDNNLCVVAEYSEVGKGNDLMRPELTAALKLSDQKKIMVLVGSYDRICRPNKWYDNNKMKCSNSPNDYRKLFSQYRYAKIVAVDCKGRRWETTIGDLSPRFIPFLML